MSAIEIDFSDSIQALEFTARHWKWLAENPGAGKTDFPELKRYQNRLFGDCGICEENNYNSGGDCEECLLYDFWEEHSPSASGHCANSVFGKWEVTNGNHERSRLALMISEAAQAKADKLKKEKDHG